MNTKTSFQSLQSQRGHRFHSALSALVLGASALAMTWGAPVFAGPTDDAKQPTKSETVKKHPVKNTGSLRDNHREYNPMTGNYEEKAPWGPRSDK